MEILPKRIDPAFAPLSAHGNAPTFWWLGQAGFAFRSKEVLCLIDPYLSDVLATKYAGTLFPHLRLHEAPIQAHEITDLTAVFCTHGHTDHMDLGSIPQLRDASNPLFVIPRAEANKGIDRGMPPSRILGLAAGEQVTLECGMRVWGLPAAHESISRDNAAQDFFMGFVIEIGGYRFYHSGDCIPFEGQAEMLANHGIDAAFLPVNGRDEFRNANGVPGNFSFEEAVTLCRDAGIDTVVCHHWGLFDFNTVPREQLLAKVAAVTDIRCVIPDVGLAFQL